MATHITTAKGSIAYEYGSQPSCTYLEFVSYLAPLLPRDDKVFYWQNTLAWRGGREMPITLFRNICHWKSRRRFAYVLQNSAQRVNNTWNAVVDGLKGSGEPQEDNILAAVRALCQLQGVKVRTASALLTAWNPNKFGIMDVRVLSVLGMPDRDSARAYVSYLLTLRVLKAGNHALQNCTLRQIELALWHYYEIQRVVTVERSGAQ